MCTKSIRTQKKTVFITFFSMFIFVFVILTFQIEKRPAKGWAKKKYSFSNFVH